MSTSTKTPAKLCERPCSSAASTSTTPATIYARRTPVRRQYDFFTVFPHIRGSIQI